MNALLLRADRALRSNGTEAEGQTGAGWASQAALVVVFGALYGACMGTFGGVWGERLLQVASSALKVPLLLVVTFALSLPSFFIFSTLFGLRADFPAAFRALIASQAGLTVVLASLAPFTLLWNVSSLSHSRTVLFNAAMFGVATLASQALLRRGFRPLIAREPRHRLMLRVWGMVYAFVGIQMGWILRPFVGGLNQPVSFFREDTWGNAYVILFDLIRHSLF